MGIFDRFKKPKPQPTKPKFNQYIFASAVESACERLFKNEIGAAYMGSSLAFEFDKIAHIAGQLEPTNEIIIISVRDEDWTPEVLFWAGLCYLKFKDGNKESMEASLKNCSFNERLAITQWFEHGEDDAT